MAWETQWRSVALPPHSEKVIGSITGLGPLYSSLFLFFFKRVLILTVIHVLMI